MPWKNQCPQCPKKFKKLERLKEHMTLAHGGFTASEIGAAVTPQAALPMDPDAPAIEGVGIPSESMSMPGGAMPADSPRRSTRRNRDLNDRLNAAIDLMLSKLLGGTLTSEQEAQLSATRGEVRNALIGVEFNFDEKIIKVGSKWMLAALMVLFYLFPYIPSVKELYEKAKAANESDKDNRDNRPERVGENVSQ